MLGVKIRNDLVNIDLKKIVNGFKYSNSVYVKGSLRKWAELFNWPVDTTDGMGMIKLYEEKNWEEIKRHCNEDVKLTHALFARCVNCGLIDLD